MAHLVASKASFVVQVPATVQQLLLREEQLLACLSEVGRLHRPDCPKSLQTPPPPDHRHHSWLRTAPCEDALRVQSPGQISWVQAVTKAIGTTSPSAHFAGHCPDGLVLRPKS